MKTEEANSNDVDATTGEVGQAEERDLLERLCEELFSGNREDMAVALGRPVDEINNFLDGETPIDEDLIMKAHGLLHERAFSES